MGSESARERDPLWGPGSKVAGRYEVEREIGRGGMGAVYVARDTSTDTRLALKALLMEHDSGVEFRREFQTLARLEHPRVVKVFDFGEYQRHLYYTMELLEGDDMRGLYTAGLSRVCHVIRDIASALAMLHARGLLHGDLSPRNIRCDRDGVAKLIDFGLLATMGPSDGVAGTPPYVAPEALYGLPLDQGADLFGLGAVFYYVLTGHHAYPSRDFSERHEQLQSRFVPTSLTELAPDVPEPIAALVTSMIAVDRQIRPGSAADVIDRLSALVELRPVPELQIARGYVRSAALIGRERELKALRKRVERAEHGRGSAVVMRGRTGAGKSRLLRELGLEAKMLGSTVVQVSMDTRGRGPFEALRAVAAELSTSMPDTVRDTVTPRVEALSTAIPEFAKYRSDGRTIPRPLDPREQRLLLQQEVTDWLTELSMRRTLVFLLDDLQGCDESSAAVMLALARRIAEARIVMVASLREDEPARARGPLTALGRVADPMVLKGLAERDMEGLVRASFGDVPNAPRLAKLLRHKTGGSPLLASQMLGALVEGGMITYQEGFWTIADDIADAALPESLAEAARAQIARLTAPTREAAKVFAVHGGPLSLELCAALVGDEPQAFAAIDELAEAEIFAGRGDAYRFRHDGIREALLDRVDEDRRAQLHLRVGTALADRREDDADADADAEVGWHLVRGGEERAGAERLERAGARLFETTAFGDALRPLSTAVEVYESHDLHPERIPELYYMLTMSGFFADRDVANRGAEKTLMLLAAHSGIERIRRMQRMLGPRAGFVGGLVQTAVARRSTDPPRRGPPTKRALQMFAHTLIMAGSLALAQTERQRLLELRQLMEPLAKIKTGNLDRVFRFLTMMEGVSFGRFGEVRDTAVALLAEAEGRRSKTWATDFELRVFEGAVRFVYGLALARSDRYRALENIEALEALGIKLWELGAQQLRRTYHLRRGETDAAKEILSRLELSYAELGSVWQLELGLGPGTALARALIGDVMGLRRSIDQLERLVERGIDYTGALDLARADYHRERGEYDVALECVDRALIGYQNGGFGRGWGLTCRAQILLEASALGRADKAIREGSDYVCDPVHRDDGVYFRFVRVEALLRAAQGEPESAATQLDAALLEAAPTENPAYLGLLHESRALVARTGGDLKGFHKHRRTAEAWFRSTDNPVLVARIERLHPTTGSYRAVGGAPDEVPSTMISASVRDVLAEPDSYTERLERALRLLVESTGAIGGYLFLVHGSRLELVVPHVGAEPPDGLVDVLRSATSRGLGWQALYRGDAGTFRALVLRIDPSLDTPAVAVAALQAGQEPLHPPEAEMVSDVAEVVSFAPPRDREPSASDSSSTSAAASDNRNDPKTIVD